MKCASRGATLLFALLLIPASPLAARLAAEPVPLQRVVALALSHSSTMAAAGADEQRAYAAYREVHNHYIPQFVLGSGLGQAWGFPLSLEGAAPSIVNLNTQSALLNPSLRDFVRAAKTDWQAATIQTKDQRNQLLQDSVTSYAELSKWEGSLHHLQQEQDEALKMEQIVNQRIAEGVDSEAARNKARLTTARVRYRMAEALGTMDVLRNRLAQMTGLLASSIETVPESIPALPDIKPDDDPVAKAVQLSPAVQAADTRSIADAFRAKAEHKALWPSADFAGQYALLSTTLANYQRFFQPNSFQRHNGTVGVVLRFPFLNESQRARARAADAEALRAKKDAETTKNRVSEETLKLQRAVEQLAAAQQVAELEYEVAQSNLEAVRIRADAGTASLHDVEDARGQSNQLYDALQDANFELQRARIALLRATGDLEAWIGERR
ncbi:MAG TPA: TolC family protein [Terriglobales bacterium]|jgi:outer membrane protein TolC|nr:TolC family protein [Terriglobales bacterium]